MSPTLEIEAGRCGFEQEMRPFEMSPGVVEVVCVVD